MNVVAIRRPGAGVYWWVSARLCLFKGLMLSVASINQMPFTFAFGTKRICQMGSKCLVWPGLPQQKQQLKKGH